MARIDDDGANEWRPAAAHEPPSRPRERTWSAVRAPDTADDGAVRVVICGNSPLGSAIVVPVWRTGDGHCCHWHLHGGHLRCRSAHAGVRYPDRSRSDDGQSRHDGACTKRPSDTHRHRSGAGSCIRSCQPTGRPTLRSECARCRQFRTRFGLPTRRWPGLISAAGAARRPRHGSRAG